MATKATAKPTTKGASAQTQTKGPSREMTAPRQTAVGDADPEMLRMMEGDAGRGVSTAAEDNIVPLVYILQSNSPQLDRADAAKYIGKGAKAGDIWFRGTKVHVDADTENDDSGILVVPCYFSKSWLEWRPDRGGFAGRHKERPKDAVLREEKADDGSPRTVWRMPSGNSVVETREHVVLVIGEPFTKPTPFVVPMKSTDHTASREWMGLMNAKTIPGTDKTAPSFGFVYRMHTIPKKNDKGSWYGWQISDAGEEDGSAIPMMLQDLAVYKMAKKISTDFSTGALKADAPEDEVENTEERGSSDM